MSTREEKIGAINHAVNVMRQMLYELYEVGRLRPLSNHELHKDLQLRNAIKKGTELLASLEQEKGWDNVRI